MNHSNNRDEHASGDLVQLALLDRSQLLQSDHISALMTFLNENGQNDDDDPESDRSRRLTNNHSNIRIPRPKKWFFCMPDIFEWIHPLDGIRGSNSDQLIRFIQRNPASIRNAVLEGVLPLCSFADFKSRILEFYPNFERDFVRRRKAKLFVPFNYNNVHWVAILIDFNRRMLMLADSLPSQSQSTFLSENNPSSHTNGTNNHKNKNTLGQRVLRVFYPIARHIEQWRTEANNGFVASNDSDRHRVWRLVYDYKRDPSKRLMPEQRDVISCGDFVCLLAWYLSDVPFLCDDDRNSGFAFSNQFRTVEYAQKIYWTNCIRLFLQRIMKNY